MGKAEKKIEIRINMLNDYLENIYKYILEKENQNNEKKIAKLHKKIENEKKMILVNIEALNKLGADIDNIYKNLKPEYQILIKEILPNGSDNTSVKNQGKRNNIINHHKDRLNKLKEAYQKYPMYDASLPVEEKLKNKLYKYEKEVGFFIYTESNKERSIYEPVWNYLEHIDGTPEFTEEEKRILQHCYKIGEEYDKYRYNRIDTKLNAIGNFVGDSMRHYGDKRYAKALSEKVFPEAIENIIYPDRKFSRKELGMLGKLLMAKFIKYSLDEEEITEYLNVLREVVSEIKGYDIGDLNNKELVELTDKENGLVFEILKTKMNSEEAFLTYTYATLSLEGRENLRYLDNYSLEELGLNVDVQVEIKS